jgi:hypothetical protein
MVTELEMIGKQGERYILRCHKATEAAGAMFDGTVSDAASWTGFRFRDNQWSFVKDSRICC